MCAHNGGSWRMTWRCLWSTFFETGSLAAAAKHLGITDAHAPLHLALCGCWGIEPSPEGLGHFTSEPSPQHPLCFPLVSDNVSIKWFGGKHMVESITWIQRLFSKTVFNPQSSWTVQNNLNPYVIFGSWLNEKTAHSVFDCWSWDSQRDISQMTVEN